VQAPQSDTHSLDVRVPHLSLPKISTTLWCRRGSFGRRLGSQYLSLESVQSRGLFDADDL